MPSASATMRPSCGVPSGCSSSTFGSTPGSALSDGGQLPAISWPHRKRDPGVLPKVELEHPEGTPQDGRMVAEALGMRFAKTLNDIDAAFEKMENAFLDLKAKRDMFARRVEDEGMELVQFAQRQTALMARASARIGKLMEDDDDATKTGDAAAAKPNGEAPVGNVQPPLDGGVPGGEGTFAYSSSLRISAAQVQLQPLQRLAGSLRWQHQKERAPQERAADVSRMYVHGHCAAGLMMTLFLFDVATSTRPDQDRARELASSPDR